MSLVQNILDAEYRVVRAPATFVERKVLVRLPEESVLRLGAEGGLGVMDSVVGRITGNDVVRRRGTALIGEVKASFLARWDDRRATQLRHRAESQRSRSYAHASRTEDMAHEQAVQAIDSTLTGIVEAKAGVSLSAADRAAERATEAGDSADRRLQVATENRNLDQRRATQLGHATDAGRHEADFWLGVADSNRH